MGKALDGAASLSDVLADLLRAVEAESDVEMLASVLLVSADGLRLDHGAAPSLPAAYSADFSEHFRWNDMSQTERTWAVWLGRSGLVSRGIVQA